MCVRRLLFRQHLQLRVTNKILTKDRPPGKGSVFSEEAENGTFRPPVASKQTKQIFFRKSQKKWLKIALK